jgi:hypothetical protein
MMYRYMMGQELFHPGDARGHECAAFEACKTSGPNGEKFRGALLVERCDGAAVDY